MSTALKCARLCVGVALLVGAAGVAVAQKVAQPLRFEVVSIHPHLSDGQGPSSRQVMPGGRLVVLNTTVKTLLRVGSGVDDGRTKGLPSWAGEETFDMEARTEGGREIATPADLQAALMALLQERFQLAFHKGSEETGVFHMELEKPGKLGAGLKVSTVSPPRMSGDAHGQMKTMRAAGVSMAEVAWTLSRQVEKKVEDHTGLPGLYEFSIEWATDPGGEAGGASVFTVLKEQLGLKLKPAKGMVETLVVERLEKPTEN